MPEERVSPGSGPHDSSLNSAAPHELEVWLSSVLRAGVLVSTVIILTGVVLIFVHHPAYFTEKSELETVIGETAFPRSVAEVVYGIFEGQGRAVIILGLMVLIATPVARVAISLLIFVHQRDKLFVTITAIVLALLLLSFFLGRAGG